MDDESSIEGEASASRNLGSDDEELLARCIDAIGERGLAAIDEVCAGDALLAERVRRRLRALERVGLLPGEATLGGVQRIGRFRILAPIGRGGMGSVYLARDDASGERVAIKVGNVGLTLAAIDSSAGESQTRSSARFEREIAAVAQLAHPSIVRVLEFGEFGGRPYFAMQLVAGPTLDVVVRELGAHAPRLEELSGASVREIVSASASAFEVDGLEGRDSEVWKRPYVELVARWALAIARALAHAHRAGIVHRDVKPGNVLVDVHGEVKLFDLGLAHLENAPGITRSSELAGTPSYVAPEQIAGSGERVDRRTDVHALGVTLFELLTLRRPFVGRTTAALLREIQSKEPPLLRAIHPQVPRELETICLTCLEKDPEHRYQSMEELADDLQRFLEFRPIQAKPVSIARRALRFCKREPALASAVVLAALVLFGTPIGLFVANRAIRGEQRRTELAAQNARREARVKSKVTSYLVDQFRLTENERESGAQISARELLDRGSQRVEDEFEEDPEVHAALLQATGTVYKNLGLFDRAIPLLDRALASDQSAVNGSAAEQSALLVELAEAHLGAGNAAAAERLASRALELLDTTREFASGVVASEATTRARGLAALGDATNLLGEPDRARASFTRARALVDIDAELDGTLRAQIFERSAQFERDRGDLERARADLERAIALRQDAWTPDTSALARDWRALGEVCAARGAVEEAEHALAKARDLGSDGAAFADPPSLPSELDTPERRAYDREFQAGITALQARDLEPAKRHFERCVELAPTRATPIYNLACAFALGGDVEHGLEWLERAVVVGFGSSAARVRTVEMDSDLAALRHDARFAPLLERMHARLARADAFAREPAIWLPPNVDRARPAPLLVVLHDDGSTKDAVLAGEWRRLASELGAILLAPSAPLACFDDPMRGMRWLDDLTELVRRPASCEDAIQDAVRKLLDSHSIDREHLWIAGSGVGAMVAFDVASRAPGLFRAVLLVDGAVHSATPFERAHRAASVGMRVARYRTNPAPAGFASDDASVDAWLEAAGFRVASRFDPPNVSAERRASTLLGFFRAWVH